ncbi:glycoside hydrolase family 35 protein [Pluteus cervinus]|uniref:Glycoside hydrolase family 35 protein n=1 Tax=Pluteus cervinus TaxID=181527 RepID=A0ACD3B0W9_9AGAR|nr:glycoside hydrolase family 35 protein [Pluteus cervinus]
MTTECPGSCTIVSDVMVSVVECSPDIISGESLLSIRARIFGGGYHCASEMWSFWSFLTLCVTVFTSLYPFVGYTQAQVIADSPSTPPNLEQRTTTGLTDLVAWDSHSLIINNQRTFILSAEYHPWRLPGNPDLWADVFQKIKTNGFNTVSFYVNWAVHYPTPGTNGGEGDFEEGTYRDIQRFIDEGKKAGLWLIARPGPYINAETTGGGFPGWVGNIAGSLRTNNANYTQAWKPYMTAISKIIARNQITNGGPIILVQAENEYSASANNNVYMQAIIDLYRANGIVVPVIHNDQHAGQAGNFSPDRSGTHVDIYCGDSYPQGANSWAQVQSVYYSNHRAAAPSNPLCLAEFGGGFLLNWGSVTRGGTGYEKYSNGLTDATFENIFYKENYAQTTTILNVYMLFGGTNWGQTVEPTVYSSYDYGGGINESRVAGPKMNEMRLQGLFLRISRDLLAANYIANGTNYTTSTLMYAAELRNPATGAGFYFVRHNNSSSTALTTTQLKVSTSKGSLTIPKTGVMTFNGREMKAIVTDYLFGKSATKILYSTAEIMTWTTIGNTDYIVLYSPQGQTGETAFLFSSAPSASLGDAPGVTTNYSNGTFTINYTLNGIHFVPITLGTTAVTVVLMDKASANNWHAPIIPAAGNFGNFFSVGTNESVLVGGPYLVRTAEIQDNVLYLTGDLNGTTPIEWLAAPAVNQLKWNGLSIGSTKTSRGTFVATLPGVSSIKSPTLGPWKVLGSLPEISPEFDDSSFTTATLTATNYTSLPPLSGNRILYSQQYGFYGGNIIFRGHFTATGQETAINSAVQYGFAGGYSAWLNGVFLGSSQGNSSISMTSNNWTIPTNTLRVGRDNVFTVLMDHTGIVETSTSSGKEPRGLRGYSIIGGNTTFSSWKLQGNYGGAANTPDTFRGYLNEGGLYAERIGAHLPGFPDTDWPLGSPLTGLSRAGINFYRTTFDLDLPDGVDNPIRLSITPSAISSNYRVQVYLNGWQVGKYTNNIGPQTIYVLPAGILRRRSTNTLCLSLWSLDATGASIAGLQLISDGTYTTSLELGDYASPDYEAQRSLRPPATFVQPM